MWRSLNIKFTLTATRARHLDFWDTALKHCSKMPQPSVTLRGIHRREVKRFKMAAASVQSNFRTFCACITHPQRETETRDFNYTVKPWLFHTPPKSVLNLNLGIFKRCSSWYSNYSIIEQDVQVFNRKERKREWDISETQYKEKFIQL